ncbi:MAG: hypothetical protein V1649_00040 [Patescibacteria group bacterium]
MTKKFTKNLMALAMILFIALPIFSFTLTAQALTEGDAWGSQKNAIASSTGLGVKDPRVMVADIIKIALGFLGIVAVVIILIGGFKWMTGGGDEAKVEEATSFIKAGVIGLIIILASFAIATFVINSLVTATA